MGFGIRDYEIEKIKLGLEKEKIKNMSESELLLLYGIKNKEPFRISNDEIYSTFRLNDGVLEYSQINSMSWSWKKTWVKLEDVINDVIPCRRPKYMIGDIVVVEDKLRVVTGLLYNYRYNFTDYILDKDEMIYYPKVDEYKTDLIKNSNPDDLMNVMEELKIKNIERFQELLDSRENFIVFRNQEKWIARDKNGKLELFYEKPIYKKGKWRKYVYELYQKHEVRSDLFEEIKAEDKEPTEIKKLLNTKIGE
ncbi:hypothetical protein [Peptostreptococcus faecalis]|uniref:hypothetical protein n=1 Tax=Peptostreptococcus faecalis TaxID=2045015 RepID=UPI000C7B28D0|nr:hypothetical protein [Peptostreptococcus faecalis]